MKKTKQFTIPKQLFVEAFKEVKANGGSAGIDGVTMEDFAKNLKGNLYKLWNRMSSGSYFPSAVKAQPIPKKSGGVRILGIPTIGDRICQTVARKVFEPMVEPWFLANSYGYRPNKSALDAIDITRQRCWKFDWVLEFDIKGLFDNIPHDLLMKAVRKHTEEKWLLLYIERWLKAPITNLAEGLTKSRDCGTPQGGVISPVLSNLFLHYVFDKWLSVYHPTVPWCRYADDGLLHCKTELQAQELLRLLTSRFKECGLELHSDKTKIIYCKDGRRTGEYSNKSFDFLGYTFRGRKSKDKIRGNICTCFTPAVSNRSKKAMRARTRKLNIRNRTDMSLEDIAKLFNPILLGWDNYYGKYRGSELKAVWRHFNLSLVSWLRKKYMHFREHKIRASEYLLAIAKKNPKLFVHWELRSAYMFA